MPNGGLLPSCWACQWAQRGEPFEVYCKKHSMHIHLSLFTFCPDLSDASIPGLAKFIESEHILGEDVYTWIEIPYRDPQYPTLPQYYHEFAVLAPISEYGEWTEEHCIA